MAAKHKFQNSHIVIDSALPPAHLLEISERVAAGLTHTKGRMNGKRFFQFGWNLAGRSAESFKYQIGNTKTAQLSFTVNAQPAGGRTRASTEIVFFRTSQDALMGVIPTGPKKLVSYPSYRSYMVELGRAVEAADPSCAVQIIERPGR